MSNIINDPVLISSIQDLARGIKSEADLSSLNQRATQNYRRSLAKWGNGRASGLSETLADRPSFRQ